MIVLGAALVGIFVVSLIDMLCVHRRNRRKAKLAAQNVKSSGTVDTADHNEDNDVKKVRMYYEVIITTSFESIVLKAKTNMKYWYFCTSGQRETW